MNQRAIRAGFVFAVVAFGSDAWAQSARIGITVDDGVTSSCQASLIPGIHSLTVRLNNTAGPVKTAKFKVVSSCPVAWYGTPPNQEYNLTFGSCIGAGAEMTNFGIQVFGSTQVCTIKVVPATGATNIELSDCDGYPMVGGWTHDDPYCSSLAQWVSPYRLDPPNGATNVPTNQLLSFVGPNNYVLLATYPFPDPSDPNAVICTSSPYPPGEPVCRGSPVNPGPLLPNTTYYWVVGNACFDGCEHGEGAYTGVYSFTTGDAPLATESSTWGHVKALYRE